MNLRVTRETLWQVKLSSYQALVKKSPWNSERSDIRDVRTKRGRE